MNGLLSPAARTYRLTATGCEALLDALADDADAATVRRRKRDREAKARKRAQTRCHSSVSLVSQEVGTKKVGASTRDAYADVTHEAERSLV